MWQLSQAWRVGRCVGGITVFAADSRRPAVWQEAQSRGVPFSTPPWWQDSQVARACASCSAKPVERWSNVDGAGALAGVCAIAAGTHNAISSASRRQSQESIERITRPPW